MPADMRGITGSSSDIPANISLPGRLSITHSLNVDIKMLSIDHHAASTFPRRVRSGDTHRGGDTHRDRHALFSQPSVTSHIPPRHLQLGGRYILLRKFVQLSFLSCFTGQAANAHRSGGGHGLFDWKINGNAGISKWSCQTSDALRLRVRC